MGHWGPWDHWDHSLGGPIPKSRERTWPLGLPLRAGVYPLLVGGGWSRNGDAKPCGLIRATPLYCSDQIQLSQKRRVSPKSKSHRE